MPTIRHLQFGLETVFLDDRKNKNDILMAVNASELKVLVADSQFLITEGIRSLLATSDPYGFAGVASTKTELMWALSQWCPRFLVIDPVTLDFDLALLELKNIRTQYPDLAFVILTQTVTKIDVTEWSKLGIINVILKSSDREEFFAALGAASKKKKYYSEEVIDLLMEVNESKLPFEETKNLTTSEIEIVKLITDGKTTKEIALQKNISIHTVNTHRKNIFRKLGVTNVSELIIYAIKAGWIHNIEYFI